MCDVEQLSLTDTSKFRYEQFSEQKGHIAGLSIYNIHLVLRDDWPTARANQVRST